MRFRPLLPSIAAAALLSATSVAADDFRIAPDAGKGSVVFESKAPMESFEGTTDQATGTLTLDPAGVTEIALRVQVEMGTLDTGIGLRNRHMYENHLHTEEFPHAVFRVTRLLEGAGANLGDGAPHDLKVEGEMTLHGVTRTIEVPLRLTWTDTGAGPRVRIESRFPVSLPDYDIPRPKFLVMKLNEVQNIRVDLWAAPGA